MTQEQKAKAYDEALKVLHKYDGANIMFSQSLKEEMFPELKESEDERIRRNIKIALMSMEENLTDFYSTHHTSQKELLAWLEKQGTERKQLYVRFGDIPSNEKSKIYRGEEEIGEENGVSVYPAFELNGNIVLGLTLPITRTTLYTQQHLLEYDNRPCYLVSGDYIGSGTDGEPLIRNISIIKRLDNYRIKEIEKQGEQKPTCLLDNSESNVKFPFKAKVKSNGKIVTIQGGQLSMVCKEWVKYQSNVEDGYKVYEPEDLESVCDIEQEFDDKVELKFHEGDWIVYEENIYQIHNISLKKYYECLRTDGTIHTFDFEYIDSKSHLWTIQDAKDGDVLYFSNETIVIFKDLYNATTFHSYCHIENGLFDASKDDMPDWWEGKGFQPATKEQRDLLFAKMHEARYEWDAEKKELKKIDKENLTEFEIAVKNVMEEAIEAGDIHNLKADAENLLRITQPTWSENDEKLAQAKKDAYNDALDKIEYHSGEPTFDDGWDAAIWYLKKKG